MEYVITSAYVEDALAGARDIIAERLSETASVRETLRQIFRTRRVVSKASKKAAGAEAQKYKMYFEYSCPLDRIAPHNLHGLLRAEAEGFVSGKIDADAEKGSEGALKVAKNLDGQDGLEKNVYGYADVSKTNDDGAYELVYIFVDVNNNIACVSLVPEEA